jgi:hypothetical protein
MKAVNVKAGGFVSKGRWITGRARARARARASEVGMGDQFECGRCERWLGYYRCAFRGSRTSGVS